MKRRLLFLLASFCCLVDSGCATDLPSNGRADLNKPTDSSIGESLAATPAANDQQQAGQQTGKAVEPRNRHSLVFSGKDYVSIPFQRLGRAPMSIELWFKPATTLSPPLSETVLFALVDGPRYSDGILCNDHMGNLGGYTYADTFNELNASTNPWKGGEWYHIAYVRDSGGRQTLYVNGVVDAQDSCFGRIEPNDEINIGGHGTFGDAGRWHFQGNIDEVRIWSRALGADEVQASFLRKGFLTSNLGLLGHWNFEEGKGEKVNDLSGNGHHGQIYGAVWSEDVPP